MVIQDYARAIESKDITNVRRVYPGMTAAQEGRFTGFFPGADRLKVTLRVSGVDVTGDNATASVSGTYDFYSPDNHRNMSVPQNLHATLEQVGGAWRLRSIR